MDVTGPFPFDTRVLSYAKRHKFLTGDPGELGDIAKAHERGLLTAPELSDFTIDQEGCQLEIALFGGRAAVMFEIRQASLQPLPVTAFTSHLWKICPTSMAQSSLCRNILSHWILVKYARYSLKIRCAPVTPDARNAAQCGRRSKPGFALLREATPPGAGTAISFATAMT
jgi:hypothetical protein